MTPSYIDRIACLGAFPPLISWLRESGHPSLDAAWAACHRGDWMLWLAGRTAGPPGSDSRRPLVLAACACARTTLHLYEEWHPGDLRPRRAVEISEAWARGEATLDDVRAAGGAFADACAAPYAASAASNAAAAYAAEAAYATAAAACAVFADAYAPAPAAAAAATDAYAYAYAVSADTSDSAYTAYTAALDRALAEMADIVRAHYPAPPSLEIP